MPELDATHTCQRLQRRITELEAGGEIAKRDIYAVLNQQQQQELESELAAQQALKKQSKARTDEEKKAAGWKTIREVRIEVLKRALAQAKANELPALRKKQSDAEVRRARIYFEAFDEARKAGKPVNTARTWANNELTRAGLGRLEGHVRALNARNKAILELEEKILQEIRSKMPASELEQLEWEEELLKEIESQRRGRKDQTD